MELPNDINILFSVINTKLRDDYKSLDELIKSNAFDKNDLLNKLAKAGYTYNEDENQFKG